MDEQNFTPEDVAFFSGLNVVLERESGDQYANLLMAVLLEG